MVGPRCRGGASKDCESKNPAERGAEAVRVEAKVLLNLGNNIVLVSSAMLSIAVALLDFLGMLDEVPWLSRRVAALSLLVLGVLVIGLVLERRVRLDAIQGALDNILARYTFGAQYLETSEAVVAQLEQVARQANESIMALGGKSRASSYLNTIEEAVCKREVTYYRLIDGPRISHQLHQHLRAIMHASSVQIRWTSREIFANLLVTESQTVLALPGPSVDRFSGLVLPGEANSRRYMQYFMDVFSTSVAIRTERALHVLCSHCRPAPVGDLTELARVLQEELVKSHTGSGDGRQGIV
jgi:hypothetical protein